ncbi:membrane fusion protein, multidrug efflux system [Oceanospirillum multiglobuliferum]|uniref:Uncharacterized protein n=1 Tax=Oceanospirillum multiglobuliferum TaxID=64969 RepID=A0A1T4SH44_9GAMM|nr:efflux RND transporter periplasmic adaptor subunit [Oceanospirillum multiglobuliferum]OPX54241.1 hypothetical protein BTE48_15190 [Oceanospirillum multiglobuliferum]SKA27476.1 membrane fusion protein, multidrug efflux system [Oceanospirillum multiglobuliferum]
MQTSSSTLNLSKISALLAIIGVIIWILTANEDQAQDEAPATVKKVIQEKALQPVEVISMQAQTYTRTQILQGQLEAQDEVDLSTQLSGTVEHLYVALGDQVQVGQKLLQLSNAQLRAEKHSAEARLKLARAELSAAEKLYSKNLQTETAILRFTHEVEQAKASLVRVQEQLADSTPTAPFSGIIDHLDLSIGEYLNSGKTWAKLINIGQLKASAEIPQQLVHNLSLHQPVSVKLLSGRTLTGEVSFIASTANTDTRSFPIEVKIDNPEHLRIAGASATLDIDLGEVQAYHLSPALLSLNSQGQLGVKTVTLNPRTSSDMPLEGRVVFQPIQLLSTGTDGAWVQGLPNQVNLITLGGGFVEADQKVQVTMSEAKAAPSLVQLIEIRALTSKEAN